MESKREKFEQYILCATLKNPKKLEPIFLFAASTDFRNLKNRHYDGIPIKPKEKKKENFSLKIETYQFFFNTKVLICKQIFSFSPYLGKIHIY